MNKYLFNKLEFPQHALLFCCRYSGNLHNKYLSTVNWMECQVVRQKRTYSTPCYHLFLATQLTCAFLYYESSGVSLLNRCNFLVKPVFPVSH